MDGEWEQTWEGPRYYWRYPKAAPMGMALLQVVGNEWDPDCPAGEYRFGQIKYPMSDTQVACATPEEAMAIALLHYAAREPTS